MSPDLSNVADGAVVAILIVFARIAYRNGFAESVWPMLMWVFAAIGGGLTWAPFGEFLHDRLGLATVPASFLAYILTSGVLALVVLGLRRLYAAQLLLLVPMGRADGFLGAGTGLVSGASLSLIILALLNPLGTPSEEVEWNPLEFNRGDAISSLVVAVFGSLHQVVLQESTVGRFVAQSIPDLLITNPDFTPSDWTTEGGDQLSMVP